MTAQLAPDVRHHLFPLASKNPLRMAANAAALTTLIRRRGIEIIHARSRAPAWSAFYAAQRTGAVFITTFHGTYGCDNRLKRLWNSVMIRGARVIAVSDFIRRHILAVYAPAAPERIVAIPRGVDTVAFDPTAVSPARVQALRAQWRLPDDELPLILLPGRLTRWKGQALLLEALARLSRPARCVFVGDSKGRVHYAAELRAVATRLGIGERTLFPGDCADMPAACLLADVVVSASLAPEAFGRVAAEAQAMARAVIAPAHGGALEQIRPGETGWLFTPGSAPSLAAMLEVALAASTEERRRIGAHAARSVFSKSQMTAATLDLYRTVHEERQRR